MKRKALIFLILLMSFFLNLSLVYVLASDFDDDGIDDDYEDKNYRDIDLEFSGDEVHIKSIHRDDTQGGDIQLAIKVESDGLKFEVEYLQGEDRLKSELQFSITFKKLIEYVDLNLNDKYDNSTDSFIQELLLDDFEAFTYSLISLSPETHLHYIIANTTDGIFKVNFYLSEEFFLINNALIAPTEAKIDIEINDFNYLNNNSRLALYIKLASESDYEQENETEDENLGFATNEEGVINVNNSFTGFFTWNENATIDGNSEKIIANPLTTDEEDEGEQILYLNYGRGNKIFHDPKIGIEGLLRSISNPPFPYLLIFELIIIGALSSSVAYAVYHYRESIFPTFFQDDSKKQKDDKKMQKSRSGLKNPYLTVISPDFYEKVNLFEWDPIEKEHFIKEMLSLTPSEREKVLDEILRKSKK